MKLTYIDPYCSGLQVVDCKSKKDIAETLSKAGMDEDSCSGEVVYYVFVDQKGVVTQGKLDFT